ncbi:MFS transporter [Amycolatopsis alkalitolerans]|uniref:MFS transporter n=1 Tax=Amycolatopsis alkalitolerans TaxID=2547244 RepID=UPI001358FD17|nr:MFS transporter [Amycolatopsis alkalitolerans]
MSEWAGITPESTARLPEGSQLKRSIALLAGPYRRNLIVLSALCVCGSIASLFLGSYSAFLAKVVGATSDRAAILFGMTIWGAYLLGNIVNIAVTDRVGRKPLLIAGGVITTLSLLLAAWIRLSKDHAGAVFAIFAVGAFAYWGGVNQAIWQYTAELFPAQIRGTARGFSTSWTRTAATASALLTPP